MPSFMLVDCFVQIETLLSKRSQMTASVQNSSSLTPSSSSSSSLAVDEMKIRLKREIQSGPSQLNKSDLDFALLKLQNWLQKFVTLSDLGFVCEQLVRLSEVSHARPNNGEILRRPTFSKTNSPRSPSSRDVVANVDQRREESVDFYVLETMHHIFAALNHHPSYYHEQDVIPLMEKPDVNVVTVVISDDAVDFCMQRLHFENSPAIQHAATQCLSMLSSHMLGSILPRFNERLALAKKDNELREYANYHKAISGLQFSTESESRFLVIVKYLEELVPLLKKCERGVLRAEICSSFIRIFEHVLKPSSRELMEKYSKVSQFWDLLEQIFSIVLKWASRGKHALFCFEMLTKVLALQPKVSFATLHEKVWKWLTDGLKQKETRKKCLELLLIDLRGLPTNALKDDSVFLSRGGGGSSSGSSSGNSGKDTQLKEMISKLLPHKFVFPDEEQSVTTNILVEIAHKHITFAMSEIFAVVLQKNSPYSGAQKALTFKALAAVAQDLPTEVDKILPTTAPLLAHYVEDAKEQKESEVIASALDCFPYIHMSNPEKTLKLAFLISKMSLLENRGITNAALLCLQRYALFHPQTTLLKTVDLFVDLIVVAANVDAQTLLHASNNLVFMISVVSEFIEKNPEIAKTIPAHDWLSVRLHIEGVVLIGLCHPEGWMRREMLLILLTSSKQCFRLLEINNNNNNQQQPAFLADEFFPNKENTDPNQIISTHEEFYEGLALLLRSPRSECFATIISYAWLHMSNVIEDVRKKTSEELILYMNENEEWFKLFKNRIYFLCLSLGPITLSSNNNDIFLPSVLASPSSVPSPSPSLTRAESTLKVDSIVQRTPSGSKLLDIDNASLRLSSMHTGPLGQKSLIFSRHSVEFLVHGKFDLRLDALFSALAEALGSVNLVAFPQLLHEITVCVENSGNGVSGSSGNDNGGNGGNNRNTLLSSSSNSTKSTNPRTTQQQQLLSQEKDAGVLSRRYLPRVLGKLFSRDVGACPEAVRYLADLSNLWLCEDTTIFENLSVEQRLGMTICLKRAIEFHSEGKLVLLPEHKEGPIKLSIRLLTSQKFSSTAATTSLTSSSLHPPASPTSSSRSSNINDKNEQDGNNLRMAINGAICELAKLVFPENMTNQFLGVMHEMCMEATTEATYTIAQKALQNFLHSHPSFLVHFVKMSIFDTHGRDPRTAFKHISLYYCNAVILNWIEQMPKANIDDTRTPAIMLAVSLIHQSSNLLEARQLALRLAHALLTTNYSYALVVPYSLRLISPPSFPMYTRATQQYSEALSSNPDYFKYIPSLLSEIVPLFENMSDLSRNNLLEILLPWLSNFVPLLGQLMIKSKNIWSQECKQQTMTVLTSLLTLTRACFSSSMSTTHISQAWNCLMQNSPKEPIVSFIQEAVGYLHSYHANSGKPEERTLLRTVFIYLSRSVHGQLIADSLIAQLRMYPELYLSPSSSTAASATATAATATATNNTPQIYRGSTDRQWKLQPPINLEMASFELITDLVFENGELFFKKHLPILLTNACVLIPRSQQSNEMLYNLSLSLHCENFAQPEDVGGKVFVEHFVKNTPSVLDKWMDMCLCWVCFSPDPYLVAQACAFLYSLQQGSFSYETKSYMIARLALVLFECVRKGHDENIIQIVKFFRLPPADGENNNNVTGYNENAFALLLSVGRALLEHSRSDYFNHGCSIILQTFSFCSSDQKLLIKRMNLLHQTNLWSSLSLSSSSPLSSSSFVQKAADQAIIDLIFKGLLNKTTFSSTSSLLTYSALHYANLSYDNGLLILSLLSILLGGMCLFAQAALAISVQKEHLRPTNNEIEKQIDMITHLISVLDVYYLEEKLNDDNKKQAIDNLRSSVFPQLQKGLSSMLNSKNPSQFSESTFLASFFQNFHVLFANTTRTKQLPVGNVKISPAEKIVAQQTEEKSTKNGSKTLFHTTLKNGIQRPKDQTKIPLPIPVLTFQCVEFLKKAHLSTVGLFRVPGDNNLIQDLKEKYEQGHIVHLTEPNSVAGVLKLYFRELSESLIPETMYSGFIAIDETKDVKLRSNVAKSVCKQLPNENRLTLNYLIHFLTLVAAQSAVNKMDATNLAMVFAPSLLRPPIEAKGINLVREMQQQQNVLEYMIKHYAEIFEEGPPNSVAKQITADDNNLNMTFNFIVQFFYRQITEGVSDWKQTLLVLFGYYLQGTPTCLNPQQILELGEMVMVAIQDASLAHTTENFGRLLVEKANDPSQLKNAFNFMRPRAKRQLKIGETEGSMKTLDREQERFAAFTASHSEPLIESILAAPIPSGVSQPIKKSPPPPPAVTTTSMVKSEAVSSQPLSSPALDVLLQ